MNSKKNYFLKNNTESIFMNQYLTTIKSSLKLALISFSAHKLRTFLAILGVTIGISSIIIVFSAGEGIKGIVLNQVESFGSDTIQIEIKVPSSKKGVASEQQSAAALFQGAQVTTLKLEDMEDAKKVPNIIDGYSVFMSQETVSYGNEVHSTNIWATDSSFIDIDSTQLEYGRFFTNAENNSLSTVAILGSNIKEKLFGENDPLGKTIKIHNIRFKVIGIMEERGSLMGFNFDDFIYTPIKTMHKKVLGISFLHNIILQVEDTNVIDDTIEEVRIVLRENHDITAPEENIEGWMDTGKDDFRVMAMTEILEIFNTMSAVLTLLLLVIVAISLVVGGISVMNVMFVIVNERTSEIGLRKAMGAKYKDIILQFLVESILITFAGGIVGSILGSFISYIISVVANSYGIDWNFILPIRAFLVAGLFSLVFGILFGTTPARKAAKMNPVEALMHED
ncbi:ABC transporter permease [Patescibacteria group bacterium]|nr:ABC transporter permease [Patescibacteria group bacterium]